MKASDLNLLLGVSRPSLHPDGTRAVVTVFRPDLGADRYVGQLWSVPLDGGDPRRISRGILDANPRFSPDGSKLAYLRGATDGSAQLVVVEATGGEPVTVTDRTLGIVDYRWSPDSSRIAFTSPVPEAGRYGTVDGLGPGAEPPRRITTQRYSANGVGYIIDRRTHLFVVEVPDATGEPVYPAAPSPSAPKPDPVALVPAAVQLTSGDFAHGAFAFSPDGSRLVVTSARGDDRDVTLDTDVVDIPLDDPSSFTLLPLGAHLDVGPLAFAPDGTLHLLAADLGETARDFIGRATGLWTLDATGPARRLTDTSIDLGEGGSDLTPTAIGVVVQNRTRGRVELLRIALDGSPTVLTPADVSITGHDVVGDSIVVAYRSGASHGDVAIVDGGGRGIRSLTDFSAGLRAAGVAEAVEREISARDGHPVHGWVLTPDGEGPHPVLLMIHGGPFAQYEQTVFDEAQVIVEAGYAVVMCNPRGAAGYGEEHARAIRQRMGTVDLSDVLDFLDAALLDPALDAARVGIMGGSYGGYLTAWTIAHDHRFAAAIVERGFLDPTFFVGTSDIGSFFGDEYVGTDAAAVAAQSPQAVVGQVATPTLVIHSSDDLRCPLSQGERYYSALLRQGVETELLVFPGETHELTRAGKPRHREQRFEAVLEWWARYLPVGGAA